MSLAVLRSRALSGMEAPAASVEVQPANRLPGLTMAGPSLHLLEKLAAPRYPAPILVRRAAQCSLPA
jgi:hypothetical protein